MTQEEEKKEKSEEKPIVIGANSGKKLSCAQCGKEGTSDDLFSYPGKDGGEIQLCAACREKINADVENEAKKVNMGGAIGLGVIAALMGGMVWYFFTILTGLEFGYLAIGLGYLVGNGVYYGAGKNRSQKLQIVSGVLTIIAIFIAEWYIFNHYVNEYFRLNPEEFPKYLDPNYPVEISVFAPEFLQSLLSPIGLLIYAIGAYVGYQVPKPQKI